MLLHIEHKTHYRFEGPVPYALQRLRLTPKQNSSQHILNWNRRVNGGKIELEYDDHNFNHIQLVTVDAGATDITIECSGDVETEDTSGVIGQHSGFAPLWYFKRDTALTKAGPGVAKILKSLATPTDDALAQLHSLSASIRDTVTYRTGHTTTDHTAEQAISDGIGVCQDHAHIFVSAARKLGYPARYVSGYLMLLDTIDQDATHAWAEAFITGLGWVGFDISNGISPDERYVKLATGLDYREAAPVEGRTFGTRDESLAVSLMVEQQSQTQ